MSTPEPDTRNPDADPAATTSRHVVTFHLGRETYAVEIARTKEIILYGEITRVPQMPDYVRGIINLRGSVIPVIDLRAAFEMERRDPDELSRIIIVRMDQRVVGLVVDAVSQVVKIPEAAVDPPPATIASLVGSHLTGVAKTDERMILLLDIDRLLTGAQQGRLGEAADALTNNG
ncbi:MAG: chemotaxis protein CheW [Planctomycetota bacterium]